VPAEFANQVAVVTGAARGLGLAIATLLAKRGATVVMVDRDASALEAAANALRDSDFAIDAVAADVTDDTALRALAAAVKRDHGGPDVLVNNAGGWRYGDIREITDVDWEWTFAVNLKSVFLTARAFIDSMIERRSGRIVNVASTDAYVAKPSLIHYAAAKAGVVSLTKSLALELAPHNILVTGVSPGAIATETAKAQDWLKKRIASIPLGRAAEPEDIAEVVVFLASQRNRFIVGETVVVNGGMYMV
jgi:NAD(P)-dependent dehydrogenase (short-subunit alcohol dehydrogenase family)